jgi:hypothetical protein
MAYLVVLTKRAAEIAKGKKDGTRTKSANKRIFFSKMCIIARNLCPSASLAESLFIV